MMIRSHKNPDKTLWKTENDNGHLKDVYLGIKNILSSLRLDRNILTEKHIDLYSKIIGYCHDIGKATAFFQEKLKTEKEEYGSPSDHSKIGAVFSYYITDFLNLSDDIKLLIYRLIYCHHSSIHKNINDLTIGDNNDARKNIILQVENILNNSESNEIFFNILKIFNIHDFKKDKFIENINKINKLIIKNILIWESQKDLSNEKENNIVLYFILYSAFTKADKYDALFRSPFINTKETREKLSKEITSDIVSNHKKILKETNKDKFKKSNLNNLREVFYNDIQISIKELDLNKDKIFQVVAPTGIGKTMTIFNAAVELKNRLMEEENKLYRIIYSLPYISIIDQTSIVLKDIMKNNKIKISGDLFLEYHYLSDTTKRGDREKTSLRIEENVMLNDFWESEIILTTFVSLLEIFASGSDLLKLTNVANSIIVLDEVQSIDAGLYKYINWFLKTLAKYINCYIILTTATMPKIFKEGEYKNLYNSKDLETKLYSNMNRYSIINLGDKAIDDFIEYLKIYLEENKEESVLVIANTKKMAYQISKELINEYDNEITHLTTATIPTLRKKYIKSINDVKNNKRKIIISTQLIEAGVDISVNTIFKFLSPYESIIQAAGRTNRNYELYELGGKLFIVNVLNEKGAPSYKQVYVRDTKKTGGDQKINNTKEIFQTEKIEESKLLPISLKYFNSLILNNYWSDIKNNLVNDNLKDFGDKIRIINDDIGKYPVFIDIILRDKKGNEKKSIDVYNKYLSIKNQIILKKEDLFKRRIKLKQMQSEFSQFCINISEYEAKKLIEINKLEENKSIPLLNRDSYDYTLGLKIFEEDKDMIK